MGNENSLFKKILGTLIRTAGDFAAFWLIFLWNDGIVWTRISAITRGVGFIAWIKGIGEMIMALLGWIWRMICLVIIKLWHWLVWLWQMIFMVLIKLWHWLVFLSPYSREAAMDPRFLYCLHWCSAVAALTAVLFIYAFVSDTDFGVIPSILIGLLCAVVVWYAGFGICFLLVKLTTCFHILAALFAVLGCAFVAAVLMLLIVYLMEL